MKLSNAIIKLKKAGYEVSSNLGSYEAIKEDVCISFFEQDGKTSKFTYQSESSCSPTFGMTLKSAIG